MTWRVAILFGRSGRRQPVNDMSSAAISRHPGGHAASFFASGGFLKTFSLYFVNFVVLVLLREHIKSNVLQEKAAGKLSLVLSASASSHREQHIEIALKLKALKAH